MTDKHSKGRGFSLLGGEEKRWLEGKEGSKPTINGEGRESSRGKKATVGEENVGQESKAL